MCKMLLSHQQLRDGSRSRAGMGHAMNTVDEYQTYARDCLRWAAKARPKNSASSYCVWQKIGRKPPRRSTLGLSQAISTPHWHGPRDLWAERAQAIASPVGWQSIAPRWR